MLGMDRRDTSGLFEGCARERASWNREQSQRAAEIAVVRGFGDLNVKTLVELGVLRRIVFVDLHGVVEPVPAASAFPAATHAAPRSGRTHLREIREAA